jgi:transcriptional regulator with XRE-family HTH domain
MQADGIRRPNSANNHRRADRTDIQIGKRLRAQRTTMGMSQAEVGRRLGVTFQQIQKYELGRNRIAASTLWQAAIILHVPLGYFFEGVNAPSMAEDEIDRAALNMLRRLHRLNPAIRRELLRVLSALLQPSRS